MKHVYRLMQRVTKSGSVVCTFHCRLTDAEGNTVLEGTTRNGIPSKLWTFTDASGAPAMAFGPNKRVLANRYIATDNNNVRLATIRMPVASTKQDDHCFEIEDQSGATFMTLRSAKTSETVVLNKHGATYYGDLVLARGDEILGYTGVASHSIRAFEPVTVATVANGVIERESNDAGLVAKGTTGTCSGAGRIRKEREVTGVTLIDAGTDLDPRFVMGVLLFKAHVFEAIRDVS